MGTTASKLNFLTTTKSLIKEAIIGKGVPVPTETTFREYADKITQITGGGGDVKDIIMPANCAYMFPLTVTTTYGPLYRELMNLILPSSVRKMDFSNTTSMTNAFAFSNAAGSTEVPNMRNMFRDVVINAPLCTTYQGLLLYNSLIEYAPICDIRAASGVTQMYGNTAANSPTLLRDIRFVTNPDGTPVTRTSTAGITINLTMITGGNYGHDQAVATIMTLPIQSTGNVCYLQLPAGVRATLTTDEIAIATARRWTII